MFEIRNKIYEAKPDATLEKNPTSYSIFDGLMLQPNFVIPKIKFILFVLF